MQQSESSQLFSCLCLSAHCMHFCCCTCSTPPPPPAPPQLTPPTPPILPLSPFPFPLPLLPLSLPSLLIPPFSPPLAVPFVLLFNPYLLPLFPLSSSASPSPHICLSFLFAPLPFVPSSPLSIPQSQMFLFFPLNPIVFLVLLLFLFLHFSSLLPLFFFSLLLFL